MNPEDIEGEIAFQFIVMKKGDQVLLTPVDEETRPESLDDVYAALVLLKRNLEAQQTAAMTHQIMMQAAQQVQQQFDPNGKKTNSGVIIPNNKNIK